MKPPLLPSESLRRVLRVARFDGLSVLCLSGGFALISAGSKDVSGAVIGLLIALAGALELHGVTLLRGGRKDGMRWLVSSQFYLMVTILAYAAFRIARPDIAWMRPAVTPEFIELVQQTGKTVDQVLHELVQFFYLCVGILTLLYQGGMMIYYVRRRGAVSLALDEPPPLV